MKTYLTAAILAVFSCAAIAAPWVRENLGRHIQETNFVLDRKCSATLIDNQAGLLLTAYHCVNDKKIGQLTEVKQNVYDGHKVIGIFMTQAELVAQDKNNDIALLRFHGSVAPFLMEATLAEEEPLVGAELYVVGNPFVKLNNTVTRGILSAKHRIIDKKEIWQTDANVYSGSSGGAVYSAEGKLIGVLTSGTALTVGLTRIPAGFNYIVPLPRIKALLNKYNPPDGVEP